MKGNEGFCCAVEQVSAELCQPHAKSGEVAVHLYDSAGVIHRVTVRRRSPADDLASDMGSSVNLDHSWIYDPQKRQRFALYRPDALDLYVELLDVSAIEPVARPLLLDGSDPVHACE